MRKLGTAALVAWLAMPLNVLAGDLHAELKAADAKIAELQNSGDASGIAMLFTKDAVRLPPDGSRIEGRQAIEKSFHESIDAGVTNVKLELTDVEGQGGLAWSIGKYSVDVPTGGNQMSTFTGNYTVVYERGNDGAWRARVDTWNDDPVPSE